MNRRDFLNRMMVAGVATGFAGFTNKVMAFAPELNEIANSSEDLS